MRSNLEKSGSISRLQIPKEDSNYHPQSLSQQSVQSTPKSKELGIKNCQGPWSDQQSIKYILFMHINHDTFNSKTKRKNLQIFKKLSEFLGSRTPRQCRSHFQKLKNRFGSLLKMRSHWKKQLGANVYAELLQKISQQLSANKTSVTEPVALPVKKLVDTAMQTDQISPKLSNSGQLDPSHMPNFQMYYQWYNWMNYIFRNKNDSTTILILFNLLSYVHQTGHQQLIYQPLYW